MSEIIVLPEEVANRIAAGEVVERPSSVVKELVENSIDARSLRIEIEIKNGGRDYIRVSDDGRGMSKDDAVIAFRRHSTSKIKSVEDLERITTFGFRGEALPSIASVSRLELRTREKNEQLGTIVVCEYGEIVEVSEIGAPEGTSVVVTQLFYNLPVRRKFLKSPQVELQHIIRVITRAAISKPNISFRFVHNGSELFFLPPSQTILERIEALVSEDVQGMLISCDYSLPEIKVFGYISRPDNALRNRNGEFIFVNGRPVDSKLISSSMRKGYGGLVPSGRYPRAILFIEIAPELVDVNVHPAKLEVRFRREELVFSAVERAVAKALRKTLSIPERVQKYDITPPPSLKDELESKEIKDIGKTSSLFEIKSEMIPQVINERPIEKESTGLILRQIHNSYILVELPDGILIIDQHAAHERILFEQILKGRESGVGKRLLFPYTMKLSPSEMNTLNIFEDKLRRIGFNFHFEGDRVIIESVPTYIRSLERGRIILRILQELESIDSEGKDSEKEFAAEMACKMAIKAGDELTEEEMDYLIRALLRCEYPNICPHGRPTQIKLTLDELETRFKRK